MPRNISNPILGIADNLTVHLKKAYLNIKSPMEETLVSLRYTNIIRVVYNKPLKINIQNHSHSIII